MSLGDVFLADISVSGSGGKVGRQGEGRTKASEAMGCVSSGMGGFVCMNHIHGFTKS